MEKNPLFLASAYELAEMIRQQTTTSEEIVRAHVDKLRKVNPVLNAMVEERYEEAIRDAQAADARIAARKSGEELPPLLGVPFTVKEMIAMKGFKSTAGNIHHRNDVLDFDATVVARMKAAGAIPLGTTNVPELGFWFESENTVYGRTSNPYDPSRTCGGSSGGEGAVVGAGASPVGLGSDIGGSVRIPAAFCGVFGHKPSHKRVPITGHFPYRLNDLARLKGKYYPYTAMGLLTRRAKDLYPLLQVIFGPDGHDQECRPLTAPPLVRDVSKIKVFVCDAPSIRLTRPVDDECRAAVRAAADCLKQLGATVEEFDTEFFKRSVELWFAGVAASEKEKFSVEIGLPTIVETISELARASIGRGRHSIPGVLTALMEHLTAWRKLDSDSALNELCGMKESLADKLGPNAVLLLPCHPRVAPRHRATWLTPFDFIYTAIFNVLENPATSVPMGLNPQGLPLSVQVVAAPGEDHLTISVAEILEGAFGGWMPPMNETK